MVAGDTVKLRFLGAWDEGYTSEGIDWEIAGLTVESGAATVLNQDFTGGDGGFTAESTAPNATWSYLVGTAPSIGALGFTKIDGVTTFKLPINWAPGRTYDFTLSGKDTNGGNLVYTFSVIAPSLPLAVARAWPASLPGPLGTAGAWGVRTFLNEGINNAEDLAAMLDFLATSDDRTPALTPESVVDSQEQTLNFVDPFTNGVAGVIGSPRPFPGEALSTSTNGDAVRDDNHVISSAHGTIVITEESDYTFNLRGDDGFMFRIKAASGQAPQFIAVGGGGQVDETARNILFFPVGTGDADTRGVVHLAIGVYKLEYATWEGSGGFWYQVSAAKGFHVNNADTTDWRAIGYISTWANPVPIPYPSMVGDWKVESTQPGATIGGNLAGAEAAVNAAVLADPVAAIFAYPSINFQDPQAVSTSRIPNDVPFPTNTPGDDDNFALRMSGILHIPESGNYLIGYQGDDGSKLTVGGVNGGFSALVQNLTGSSTIGRANNILLNSGTAGAAANSLPDTSVVLQQPGALAASTDKAIATDAVAGPKVTVPFTAALNPINGAGEMTPFTVEAWAKPLSLTGGAQAVVNSMIAGVNQNPANADDRSGYSLRLNNGTWQFYVGHTDSAPFYDVAEAPDTATEGAWQHVVGVWDGTNALVYVDGVKAGEVTPATPPLANYAAPLYFGKRGYGDWLFKGDIDEAAVYGGALDEATIASHHANGIHPAPATPYQTLIGASNPAGYWRLNEIAGARVDTGTISTDIVTGDSSTVGRIFLAAGDYPISSLFWETGGGASYEIFATRDVPEFFVPVKPLTKGGFPTIYEMNGLALVPPPAITPPVLVGSGLTVNANNALSITFQSVAGSTYTLESSVNLIDWQALESNIEATGAVTTVTGRPGEFFFYTPGDPRRYYRIKGNP